MINLLPPEIKQAYHYALRNTMLRRWVIMCIIGLAGVGIIATYGLVAMQRSINTYSSQVATTQAALTKEQLATTEAKVRDITGSLKLVVKVLSKEILFSKLLKQIATTIPPNAVLTNLNIIQTTGAIDITAQTNNYTTATQVQVNLQDPANKIFSKADLLSINCISSPSDPRYPCTVQVRALFAPNNPDLFINSKGS